MLNWVLRIENIGNPIVCGQLAVRREVHFTRIERIMAFATSLRTLVFTALAMFGGWLAALLVAKVTRARYMGGFYLHCIGYAELFGSNPCIYKENRGRRMFYGCAVSNL